MTEQPPPDAPPPATPPPDAPPAAPPDAPADAAGLTPDEETELGTLIAKREAGISAASGGTVRMKIDGPDGSSMTFGGITVTTEYTDVPAAHAASLMSAADDAGMTIEQEVS